MGHRLCRLTYFFFFFHFVFLPFYSERKERSESKYREIMKNIVPSLSYIYLLFLFPSLSLSLSLFLSLDGRKRLKIHASLLSTSTCKSWTLFNRIDSFISFSLRKYVRWIEIFVKILPLYCLKFVYTYTCTSVCRSIFYITETSLKFPVKKECSISEQAFIEVFPRRKGNEIYIYFLFLLKSWIHYFLLTTLF